MLSTESLKQCIERLSALPRRERLEAFHAISDLSERRQVARALPPEIYSEILAEAMLENLNRNAREFWSRQKPDRAA